MSFEDENGRLKRFVADLSLDTHLLTEAVRKKSEATQRRKLAVCVQSTFAGALALGP